ncbi:MAG: 4Fe-4S binding protein [Anaerolineae bacterium]|nr:4Fe-4S binding protein [Anaerolineae bacterium]
MKRGETVKTKTDAEIVLDRKMVTLHNRMVWDLERCIGCQIGPLTCPKDAITHVPGVVENGHLVKRASADIDPEKCIFCGMCAVMCPTNAITAWVDGKVEVPVQKFEAFPTLVESTKFAGALFDWERRDFVIDNCPTNVISFDEEKETLVVDQQHCIRCRQCEVASDGAFQVVQPWEGTVELFREKCVEGCTACADICPTRALHIAENGELALADYYCIKCGACMQVCPIKATTETYDITFESHGVTYTRAHERITNRAELPIVVDRWRVKHTPVESGAWVQALMRLADDKAGMVEIDRKRALRRKDLLKALKGASLFLEE